MYKLVLQEAPPLNTLVRTYNNDPEFTQKAILKDDGWYWPSGEEKLPWIPTHWQLV